MVIRRAIPFDTGTIHFVGIGGIGMSGIAAVMKNLGYDVTGSDAKEGANLERLRAQGITISIGHKAENTANAGVVVISSAIKDGNPEVDTARARGVPVTLCGEMAGRPLEAMALIGMGFRSLSMAPASIGPVKQMVLSLDFGRLSAFMADLYGRSDHTLRDVLKQFATDQRVVV